jgi:hypothetical protein
MDQMLLGFEAAGHAQTASISVIGLALFGLAFFNG